MELCVTNLGCARGGIAVLQGVHFAVQAGQALILRGPNGIGKTTLLRTIAGLQPALTGTVSAGGQTLAYAGHADGVKATLTVAENLQFWAAIYGRLDIRPAMAALALTPLADRRAAQLSAGQKRRLGLARLILTGPSIWLMDEPTISLDTASLQLFGQVVQAHLGQGGVALIASHIDLGLDAATLDLSQFRAKPPAEGGFAGVFEAVFQ